MTELKKFNHEDMTCPWCGVDVDLHEPSVCLNAWVASLMGYRVIKAAPGELRCLYRGDDCFEIIRSEETPDLDGQLFIEVDRDVYGDSTDELRQVFAKPCVSKVPNYSANMSFSKVWTLVDETAMFDRKERDVFMEYLERELRKKAGEDFGWPDLLFLFQPHLFCRAFIKTKLLRLSRFEDHVLAAERNASA